MAFRFVSILAICTLFSIALADDHEDAQQLHDEALQTLKEHSKKPVSSTDYAMAIYRLEKARGILEKAKENDSDLAQEVNSALFWARRCSNLNIMKELDKIHASNPALPLASQTLSKPLPADAKEKVEEGALPEVAAQKAAREAFERAKSYADKHSGDEYSVALRYFQMANEFPGTDYAMKAMSLAQEFQRSFALKFGSATQEKLPDSPDMTLVKQADEFVKKGSFEDAFRLYKQSICINDGIVAHRKLGHAYFSRAQQWMDDLNKRFEQFQEEYKAAYDASWIKIGSSKNTPKEFNSNNPKWQAAKLKYAELMRERPKALFMYVQGQFEFEKVLKLAPEGRDFDAAAYIGISMAGRPEASSRAVQYLQKFLKDYEPANDIERSIYEYCKSELERLNRK